MHNDGYIYDYDNIQQSMDGYAIMEQYVHNSESAGDAKKCAHNNMHSYN